MPTGGHKLAHAYRNNEIQTVARAAHEQLESWIAIICRALIDEGVNQEQASPRMITLLEKMQLKSGKFPPAVAALTLTALLNFQLDRMIETQDDKVACQVRDAITGFGKVLATLLKEKGRREEDVTGQVQILSGQLIAFSDDSGTLIFALAVAVALDNHATLLLKGAIV